MKKFILEFRQKMIYVGRMFRVLWSNDRIFLLFILLDIVLSSISPFIQMFLVKHSINMLTNGEQFSHYLTIVLALLVSMFIVTFLQSLVSTKSGVLGNMIGDKLFRNIFNKTMEIDYEMLLDKDILEKRQLAMQVIEQGRFNNLAGNFKQFISNAIVLIGVVYLLSSIEFWILLIVVGIVVMNSFSTSTRKKAERTIYTDSVPVNHKIEYFWSINSDFSYGKEIRTYDMQDSLNEIHHGLTKTIQNYVEKVFSLQLKGNMIFLITNLCLNSVIYLFLGYKILVKKLISVGDFSLYLNAITTFNNSVQVMIASYIDISNNGQYLKDYFDFIELKSKYSEGKKSIANHEDLPMEFVFENVSFTYPYQSEPSLRNINLTIRNKERLSIVGENGAGKTTLVKLLLRLYEPTEGRILLNGVDIKEIDYKDYLKLFSTVFQDFKLFAFRILDNVTALANNTPDLAGVQKCLDKAGLSSKISTLDKGIETYIYKIYEEDGVELSGGEAQKLAIARALYKDAPVVILDEPTAALDPKAEYDIYLKFLSLVDSKTSIFISHRLSSTKFCDRIVVLRDGQIVELGSHSELLAQKGYYAELFNMQAQFYLDE